MKRLVCDCMRVYEDEIKESFIKNNGDIEKVKEETQAAIACTRCLHKEAEESHKVDICFPSFIEELKRNLN